MPPEMFGSLYCGEKADVWSLGCTFYSMFAGKPLFWKGEKFQIDVYKAQAQNLSDITRTLEKLKLPPDI